MLALLAVTSVVLLLSLKQRPKTIKVKVVWSTQGCQTEPGIYRVYPTQKKERKIQALLKMDPSNPLGAHTENARRVHMTIMHLSQSDYQIAEAVDTNLDACTKAKIYTLEEKTSEAGFFQF